MSYVGFEHGLMLSLTPARTLVISSTLMPANGSVDASGAAVANPCLLAAFMPLKKLLERCNERATTQKALEVAMPVIRHNDIVVSICIIGGLLT